MLDKTDGQEPVTDDDEEPASAESLDDGAEAGGSGDTSDEDPWEAVKSELGDVDPHMVAKTWKQYTQTREELLKKERELEPLADIQRAFAEDPEFARYVSSYAQNKEAERTAEDIAKEARENVEGLKFRLDTERAVASLRDKVKSKEIPGLEGIELPDFSEEELYSYAASHKIGDLSDAYIAMNAKAIAKASREAAIAEVKRKKADGVVTKVKGAPVGGKASLTELQNMSDSDFMAMYKNK